MKNIFSILAFLVVLMGMGHSNAQQLPQFSQYMFNGLHINPAYAGYKGEHYVQSTYRSQWAGLPGAPTTFTLTADISANEGLMGFGAAILSDEQGPAKTNSGLLTYAYRIQTGDASFLGFGISGGLTEYAIDGSMFNPNDFDDAEIPEGRINRFTPNLNTGIFFHSPDFYAGFSAYNLVGKKALEDEAVALAYHNVHYYLTAGGLLPLSDQVQFKPSFLLRSGGSGPGNLDLNGMFLFIDRVWAGASYRTNLKLGESELPEGLSSRNAVALILELFATEKLRFGYAYDVQTNAFSGLRNNSHEISLGYYISPRKVNMNNPRWF
ncbi:type IX secretion system membrane protein, PorP/SprF family [Cyclobacterium lianum]|uniref:Type IX secretion system membrane protein, PorP/SprF family n=1 Tax=Cyclobacterium lianum TaxID=388280 RepID=A0A1M7IF45_9BACT|nr:type IX secretion system membrane protein PorP/SprF [Cyclobacterium lianum]SHM39371.1 type IX secretion system membrane protein, PorP/SprF family [Cyclobacterium lianum]